jgi:hypothetical protein
MEEKMSPEPKRTPPKNGQRVQSTQHGGVFEIVGVNALMQTASIRLSRYSSGQSSVP